MRNKEKDKARKNNAIGATIRAARVAPPKWSDIKSIDTQICNAIMSIGYEIQNINQNLLPRLNDELNADYLDIVKSMMSDMDTATRRVETIRTKWQDKKGIIHPEDLMVSYAIGQEYSETQELFMSLVGNALQSIKEIGAQLEEIESKSTVTPGVINESSVIAEFNEEVAKDVQKQTQTEVQLNAQ